MKGRILVAAAAIAAAIAFATLLFLPRTVSGSLFQGPLPSIDAAQSKESSGEGGVDWDYWLGVNPEIVGWITVPGTAIDGPVAQAPSGDSTYYLSHDAHRNPSVAGCAYVDAACEGFDGLVSVVSGHHVTDGSVFSDLSLYLDRGFANDHRNVVLETPQRTFVATINGAELISGAQKAKRTQFATPEMMRAWYTTRVSGCDVVLHAGEPEHLGKALVLVTCATSDPSDDRRVIVYCSIAESSEA